MCGTTLWDWLVLDLAYVLALLGGAMVLRASSASPLAWLGFGGLSTSVGAFLLVGTNLAHRSLGASLVAMAAVGTGC